MMILVSNSKRRAGKREFFFAVMKGVALAILLVGIMMFFSISIFL